MAAAGFWSRLRALAQAIPLGRVPSSRAAVPLFHLKFPDGISRLRCRNFIWAALTHIAFSSPALAADPVRAEATASSGGGYARLVVKFAEDVNSEVLTAGSIIVIRFERPVDVSADRLAESVPDYIGSARRDPDGSAVRLSLSRRVTVNTMTAGERLFIDLLPETWKGPPPALPNEVVRELSERARAAERELRQQRALSEAKKRAPVRVRASVQPTFVRFVFEMPDGVGVSSVLNEQKLKLVFTKALTFDLADAKVSLPPNVAGITQKIEGDTAVVELVMMGDVDVHSFREDKNYVIDVAFQQPDKDKAQVLPQVSDAAHAPPARIRKTRCRPWPSAPASETPVQPTAPVPRACDEDAPRWPKRRRHLKSRSRWKSRQPRRPASSAAISAPAAQMPRQQFNGRAGNMPRFKQPRRRFRKPPPNPRRRWRPRRKLRCRRTSRTMCRRVEASSRNQAHAARDGRACRERNRTPVAATSVLSAIAPGCI